MITELVQPIIKLIPHQLLLTSTISNQTNLPPIHPLTADVNYDYWNQTVVIAMIQNYTKLLNELKELKRKTHKFLKKMTISGIRKFGNLLLENGYIYPNETGFNDYFISIINEQYDSKKKEINNTQQFKNAMFTVFGNDKLDYINSQSSIKELKEWKTFSKTEWCRKNLFKTIENNNNNTYIAEITLKIWPAVTELVQPIIKLIPHQLLLTSTISNQTNLPPIHPLTADVNYDYWNQTVVIAMIQNYTKLLNELKELKRKTHKFLKKMTISGIRKFGNLLLENGYIYPNETGFNDYFISIINEQYDSKKKEINNTQQFKNAMFTVFGNDKLDYINSQSSIKELKEWKTFSKTEWCRKNLFKTIENNNNNTYIAEITLKIWPAGIPSQSLFYFAMIVVSLLLDPKHGTDMKDKHVVMR
ncbi:7841_t:CDS:2, partial [Entrophospora sp. SA101]